MSDGGTGEDAREPESAPLTLPEASASDEPFGLWQTGRAPYQTGRASYQRRATPYPSAATSYPSAATTYPSAATPYPSAATAHRSSATRGRVAMLLVSASVATYGATAAVNLWLLPMLDAAERGAPNLAELELHDALVDPLNLLTTGVFLFAAVAVLAWLSRVVDNVPALTGQSPRFSPRESIGWWFAPFANLVMPYQVVRDVAGRLARVQIAGLLVLAWWLLYLFSNIASYALMLTLQAADTIEGLRSFVGTSMVYLVPRIVAGILLVLIVRAIEGGAAELEEAVGWRPASGRDWPTGAQVPDGRTLERVVASADGPVAPPPPPA